MVQILSEYYKQWAEPKLRLTEFGIHQRLESCELFYLLLLPCTQPNYFVSCLKRYNYDVLVNLANKSLVWRRDYDGHVPDTAVLAGVKVATARVPPNAQQGPPSFEGHDPYHG